MAIVLEFDARPTFLKGATRNAYGYGQARHIARAILVSVASYRVLHFFVDLSGPLVCRRCRAFFQIRACVFVRACLYYEAHPLSRATSRYDGHHMVRIIPCTVASYRVVLPFGYASGPLAIGHIMSSRHVLHHTALHRRKSQRSTHCS